MIRAPNQFLPKTKVVDLIFLYNFYFGQIPSFYMKFRLSTGQTRVNLVSNEFTVSDSVSTVAAHAGVWPSASVATRRDRR